MSTTVGAKKRRRKKPTSKKATPKKRRRVGAVAKPKTRRRKRVGKKGGDFMATAMQNLVYAAGVSIAKKIQPKIAESMDFFAELDPAVQAGALGLAGTLGSSFAPKGFVKDLVNGISIGGFSGAIDTFIAEEEPTTTTTTTTAGRRGNDDYADVIRAMELQKAVAALSSSNRAYTAVNGTASNQKASRTF
jgi:hypothetical protein